MRILLVCMAGMTTNVVATKLQLLANQQGRTDTFSALGIYQVEEEIENFDFLLIAPQVKAFAKPIQELATSRRIPYKYLDGIDISLMNVEPIYEVILKEIQYSQITKIQPVEFSWAVIKQIILFSLVDCGSIFIIGMLACLVGCFIENENIFIVINKTLVIFNFYLALSVGNTYAKIFRKNRLILSMIVFMATVMLLPISDISKLQLSFSGIDTEIGYFGLTYLNILFVPFFLFMSIIVVYLYHEISKRNIAKLCYSHLPTQTRKYFFSILPGGIILGFCLLLRWLIVIVLK